MTERSENEGIALSFQANESVLLRGGHQDQCVAHASCLHSWCLSRFAPSRISEACRKETLRSKIEGKTQVKRIADYGNVPIIGPRKIYTVGTSILSQRLCVPKFTQMMKYDCRPCDQASKCVVKSYIQAHSSGSRSSAWTRDELS